MLPRPKKSGRPKGPPALKKGGQAGPVGRFPATAAYDVTLQILAYSVTVTIPINSTLNGTEGEYNTDILRLALSKQGIRGRGGFRRNLDPRALSRL